MAKSNGKNAKGGGKPKLTKEERRAKYTRIARDRRQQKANAGRPQHRKLVCFLCRATGHAAQDCPQNRNNNGCDGTGSNVDTVIQKCCYMCGSLEHSLSSCAEYKKRQNNSKGGVSIALPFAVCFVCNEKGHLASQCSKNDKGIYVNGGSCKVCGSNQHLSSHCPERKSAETKRRNEANNVEQDSSDLMEDENASPKISKQASDKQKKSSNRKRKIVRF